MSEGLTLSKHDENSKQLETLNWMDLSMLNL